MVPLLETRDCRLLVGKPRLQLRRLGGVEQPGEVVGRVEQPDLRVVAVHHSLNHVVPGSELRDFAAARQVEDEAAFTACELNQQILAERFDLRFAELFVLDSDDLNTVNLFGGR